MKGYFVSERENSLLRISLLTRLEKLDSIIANNDCESLIWPYVEEREEIIKLVDRFIKEKKHG